MNNLKKLQIIIPTYNREDILISNLKYLNNYNLNILILDSSKKKIQINLKEKFKNLSIQYIYKRNLSYRNKFLWFVNNIKINKKYSILLADDDFYLIPTLEKQIGLLEKKKLYSCVVGKSLYATNFFGKVFYRDGYGVPIGLNDKNPIKRLKNFFCKKNVPVMYSLCRSSLLLSAIRNMLHFNLGIYALYEIVLGILIIYNTKILFLNQVYWIKSLNDFKTSSPAGTINFKDFWNSSKFKNKKFFFLKKISKILFLKKKDQYLFASVFDQYSKKLKNQNKLFQIDLYKSLIKIVKILKLYILKRNLSFLIKYLIKKNIFFPSHDLGLKKNILKELKLIEKYNA